MINYAMEVGDSSIKTFALRGVKDTRPTCMTSGFLHRQAVGGTKDDVRPLHMLERAITIRDDGQQTLTIFGGRKDTDGLSHARRLAHPPEFVNHPTASVH
jgi:hypothetical protein